MKVLRFLDQISADMAFGKAVEGVLFGDIHGIIGGESTLSTTLHYLRGKGYVEARGGFKSTRYRITAAGHEVVNGTFS